MRTPEWYELQGRTVTTYLLSWPFLSLKQPFSFLRQIMMSSGGMLMEKLDAEDPQLDKLEPFDGVVAYSQEKVGCLRLSVVCGPSGLWCESQADCTRALLDFQRQQVELAHILAERYPELGSYSTHPGWADTAGMLPQGGGDIGGR
jgi:dehydrogenase/reductase SDR family protein 12